MRWVKFFVKAVFLIVPIFLVIGGAFVFLVLPHMDPAWTPLIFVIGFVAVMIANWIWPLDSDT
jgi:hypothetical protein